MKIEDYNNLMLNSLFTSTEKEKCQASEFEDKKVDSKENIEYDSSRE